MPNLDADVALLTECRYAVPTAPEGDWYVEQILHDDRLLQEALQERGVTSTRIDWAHPDVDWSTFSCAVFRTTWDYFERFEAFTSWLEAATSQVRLCNTPELVWWNLDKHYLADLNERGIPVVDSQFIEQGARLRLEERLAALGWGEAVIKPCISAGGRDTYRVQKEDTGAVEETVQPLLEDASFILQPFLNDIVDTGEVSLMVFDGDYTHAIRKAAKDGDFRVQDNHGGTVHPYEPSNEQIELALRAMDACDPVPRYGRVDIARTNEGRWAVMELELIEPELWLRDHPPSADAFARVIVDLLDA